MRAAALGAAVAVALISRAAHADEPAASNASSRRIHHIVAWIAGGIGVAGIGVGVAHGIGSLEDWHSVQNQHLCDAGHVCNPEGVFLTDRSNGLALGADIVIGSGLLVTGAAVVIWLTAPDATPSTAAWVDRPARPSDRGVHLVPAIAPGSAGALLVGRF